MLPVPVAPPPACIRGLPARVAPGLPAKVALDIGCALVVVAPNGSVTLQARSQPSDSEPATIWDGSRVVVDGTRLLQLSSSGVRTIARHVPLHAQPSPQPDGRIVLTTADQVLVLSPAGRVLSAARLPHGLQVGTLLAASGARVALTGVAPRGGRELLLALPPGARRLTVLGPLDRPNTCAGFGWAGFSGRFVLVQIPGQVVRVYDTARRGRTIDLSPLARALRARHRSASAGWLTAFRRA
jgi:hypothetical protein